MGHAATSRDGFLGMDPSLRGPFFASGLFHLTVLLLATFGLPFIMHDKPLISAPISVEIVPVDEITQTNKIAAPVKEEKKEEPKEPPKPEKPSPPKMEAAPEPAPLQPVPAPPEKIKPPEDKALKPAPKKPPVKMPDEKKAKPKDDFDTLLKNLTPDADKKIEPQKDINDILASVSEDAQPLPLGERMTMSETDALVNGLRPCWNILSGAKFAENIVVEVRVTVNPDRTVQQATIINQGLYNTDSHIRAAGDAALRALRNPRCSPLQLPPGKYNQWKSIVINFDPREML